MGEICHNVRQSMLICQVIELKPSAAQTVLYPRHAAAARIARNDVIALWCDEGRQLPGFRCKLSELCPVLNRDKFAFHPWMKDLCQNAVKGGAIDAQDAIVRHYEGLARRLRFHGRHSRRRFRADNSVRAVKVTDGQLVLPRNMGSAARVKERNTGKSLSAEGRTNARGASTFCAG